MKLTASPKILSLMIAVLIIVFVARMMRNPTSSENRSPLDIASQVMVHHCGKTCSYDYDSKQDAKYYPLLRKAVDCRSLMYRLAHPPYDVIRPPPQHPPKDLVNDYTQNGECPITYWPSYLDDSGSSQTVHFTRQRFVDGFLEKDKVASVGQYGDSKMIKETLLKYAGGIINKHVVVIGTQYPWAEAILINIGAARITTVEYSNLTIDYDKIQIITPYKLGENFIGRGFESFDSAFSYSSIEHTGLGRYGDPIAPFGDLEAVAQVWCVLKPGAYFFLSVPVNDDRKCKYEWNAHRVYGPVRLQHLTANWEVVDEIRTHGFHMLYVLKKL